MFSWKIKTYSKNHFYRTFAIGTISCILVAMYSKSRMDDAVDLSKYRFVLVYVGFMIIALGQFLGLIGIFIISRLSINEDDSAQNKVQYLYWKINRTEFIWFFFVNLLMGTCLIYCAHNIQLDPVVNSKKPALQFLGPGLAWAFMLYVIIDGQYWWNNFTKRQLKSVSKAKSEVESELDRSDNLLLNILPADIAAELKEKGRAEARDFDLVSILFTDFKDFTLASVNLNAQDLVAEINTCFEAFDAIMAKYGVEKIKTIGDAYMAAGGLPVPTDDSVKNTVLAALEMQEFISARSQQQAASSLPFFEMRVGIHTGPVVAGIVGVKKFQYDIWGDTVNTASRMESSGEVGKVNISQATYELLKNDPVLAFENRGKIEAKGKGEMEMYFVSKS